MRYSPTTRGFYDDFHPEVPEDAADIDQDRYMDLLTAQSRGAEIVPDADGLPVEQWPVPPTPEEQLAAARAAMKCSRFQARAALHAAGLLEVAEKAIAGADAVTQIAWADAAEWRRDSPTIATIASKLKLSDKQLDDLFSAAADIRA